MSRDPDGKPDGRESAVPAPSGARWWNRAIADDDAPSDRAISRRAALALLGTLAAAGASMTQNACDYLVDEDAYWNQQYYNDSLDALTAQRTYGWNFGAASEYLVFSGSDTAVFDLAAVDRLEADVAPVRYPSLGQPTLFQAPTALPTLRAAEESAPFAPLRTALRPVHTYNMDVAFRVGEALSSLLINHGVTNTAFLVDLHGEDSVAFGAGAAGTYEPVFLFDNWPHPRGVVPIHLALGACLYYQPLFVARRAERAGRTTRVPPAFLLERRRLTNYLDDSEEFDNRHMARLPTIDALRAAGIARVLYVIQDDYALPELDDLTEDLVDYASAGIEVRVVTISSFMPAPGGDPDGFYYGGSLACHDGFLADYGWLTGSPVQAVPPPATALDGGVPPPREGAFPSTVTFPAPAVMPGDAGVPVVTAPVEVVVGVATPICDYAGSRRARQYRPVARFTMFTRHRRPTGFGMCGIIRSRATSAVLGARIDRRGSWNRSSGGSSG